MGGISKKRNCIQELFFSCGLVRFCHTCIMKVRELKVRKTIYLPKSCPMKRRNKVLPRKQKHKGKELE